MKIIDVLIPECTFLPGFHLIKMSSPNFRLN